MQRRGIGGRAFVRVARDEATRERVHVASAQVVEAHVRVKLLADKQVIVWRRACARDERTERVVVVRVRYCAARVREEPHAAGAVVAEVAHGPTTGGELSLADQIVAEHVSTLHRAVDDLLDNLRVTRRVSTIDKVFRRHTANGLRDAIAVAVVNKRDGAAINFGEPVFEGVIVSRTT